MDEKQKIRDFLKSQTHMIISTVNKDNLPESAFVGFAESEDLSLILGTSTSSRKYRNVQTSPHVAIVFGGEEGITVQYEGILSILEGEELNKYKQIYFTKSPSVKKYENNKDQIYLKVIPSWIRYTDYTQNPEEIFEILF